jgi:hypothetical protein
METGQFIISVANPVRFVCLNGQLQSFDNTLFSDEVHYGGVSKCFDQQFLTGETVNIQVKADTAATLTMERYFDDGTMDTISPSETTVYTDYQTIDFSISLSTASRSYFYVYNNDSSSVWQSEWVSVEDELTDYLKLEWFNLDPADTENGNFNFDYSTTSASSYVNYMYIPASLSDYKPGGKSTLFDNQNEMVKVKENIFRKLTLKTDLIPAYLAEKIIVAQSHDVFSVNEVVYVCEQQPQIDKQAQTNLVVLTAELTQQSVLGLNTDDIGFDVDNGNSDSMIENKTVEGATASGSFAVSAGFTIQQVVAKKNSGTNPSLKLGTTVGGDEIMPETVLTTTPISDNLVYTPSTSATWTIYYTLGGTSPNIDLYILTINHKD